MQIGVDAQPLLEQSAGVTYYTRGILGEVLKQDRKNYYDLFLFRLFPKVPIYPFGKGPNFSYRYQRFFPFKAFYKLYKWGMPLPLELFFGPHDLYFFPSFVAYPHRGGKSVVVVHDLSFEKVPQYVQDRNVDFLKKFVPLSVQRADHVIAISQFTKKDLIETYGVPEGRIAVVYPAVDHNDFYPRSGKEISAIKKKYGLKKPFLLYLGTLEPRKNIPAILKAYAALKKRKDLNLVLAGKTGWFCEEIFETIRELNLGEDVVLTGYVPQEDRPLLLSAAEVFFFPSFFEGFGMPVLEAQACGIPVITSNVTSLPESAGDAAVLVDPRNTDAIGSALEGVLSSSHLREELKRKGIAHAKHFNWSESARKLIKVFNELS